MRKEAIDRAKAFSKAGFTIFKCQGKRPARGLKWRKQQYLLPFEVEEYLGDWDGNYAVAPTIQQLIVDVDPRNFEEGDKPHVRLFEALQLEPQHFTTVVKTGGDPAGLHIYFTLPKIPHGHKIKKNIADYPGIDFISEGAYVIGAGSIHPDTGNEYQLAGDKEPKDMGLAPKELMDIILVQTTKVEAPEVAPKDDEASIQRFRDYIKETPGAVEGESGDRVTFQVACKGRDFGLSVRCVFDIMAEDYNPKCVPNWPLEDLLQKVDNAFKYAQNSAGSSTPEADFPEILPKTGKHREWRGWDYNDQGKKRVNANNIQNFFINFHEGKSPLHHAVAFNEFTGLVTKTKFLPWDRATGKRFPKQGIEWSDSDTLNLATWLSVTHKFDISKSRIEDSIVPIAQLRKVHPLRDYLDGLKWDGISRLKTWLIDNSGLKNDKVGVNKALSKLLIMQAVDRAYHPGCKADYLLILEGKQGIRKSTLVRVLGGEYYADIAVDPAHKDTVAGMRGKWILEMSEMMAYRRVDVEQLKRFITNQEDRVRPAYARRSEDLPRQCVFISTVNPDATGQYFTDPTGNRRFLPLDCGEKMIDVVTIDKMRNQLFAEAAFRIMQQGEESHITDPKILKAIEELQRSRKSDDVWREDIVKYLHQQSIPEFVTASEIFQFAIGGSVGSMHAGTSKRIANCLRELGYVHAQRRENGKTSRGYRNGNRELADL